MKTEQFFSAALGLQSPLQILNSELEINDSQGKELHIHICFTAGHKFSYEDIK